jgi:hypothetical protein
MFQMSGEVWCQRQALATLVTQPASRPHHAVDAPGEQLLALKMRGSTGGFAGPPRLPPTPIAPMPAYQRIAVQERTLRRQREKEAKKVQALHAATVSRRAESTGPNSPQWSSYVPPGVGDDHAKPMPRRLPFAPRGSMSRMRAAK